MVPVLRGLGHALPVSGCIAGLLGVFSPMILSGLRFMHGGLGDPRLVNYTLEHGYRWLGGLSPHGSFWDAPLFYPQLGVSAYTDPLLGLGPLYWPWRLLGAAPDTAFQLWMLAAWSLNYLAAWLLLRRFFGASVGAAALGAYLFAFGSRQVSQFGHQQLVPLFYVVAGFAALLLIFGNEPGSSGRQRAGVVLLTASVVLQAWSAYYPLFVFGLLVLTAAAWALVLAPARRRLLGVVASHWPILIVSALLVALAILPLALHCRTALADVGPRPYRADNLPRPASWFLMGSRNVLYGWLQKDGPFTHLGESPHSNGIGFVTLAVCMAGLALSWRRTATRILVLATVSLALLCTAYGGFDLWRHVRLIVPGAVGIRAVGRVGMILALPSAIGAAIALDWIRVRRGVLVATLVALVCVAEQAQVTRFVDKHSVRGRIESVARLVEPRCSAFFLAGTGPPDYNYENDDAAWVQLEIGTPTINGRYGNTPPDWAFGRFQLGNAEPGHASLKRALEHWVTTHHLDPASVCWIEYEGLRELPTKYQAFGVPYSSPRSS